MAFDIMVPDVVFKTRKEIDTEPGFIWYDLTSQEVFAGKRVAIFALPGAFTPTCSSTHLPGFEMEYDNVPIRAFSQKKENMAVKNTERIVTQLYSSVSDVT